MAFFTWKFQSSKSVHKSWAYSWSYTIQKTIYKSQFNLARKQVLIQSIAKIQAIIL